LIFLDRCPWPFALNGRPLGGLGVSLDLARRAGIAIPGAVVDARGVRGLLGAASDEILGVVGSFQVSVAGTGGLPFPRRASMVSFRGIACFIFSRKYLEFNSLRP
jgi:hypothetical protein